MAIAVGQSASASAPAFGSVTTLTTGAVTTSATGSVFAIFVNSKTSAISSVSDSYSNTYTLRETGSGFNSAYIYTCDNGSGGAGHTVTVNFAATTPCSISFVEVTGAANPSLDVGANGSNTSGGTTTAGAAVTTTNAADLVLSYIGGYGGGSTSVSDSGSGFSIVTSIFGSGVSTGIVSAKVASSTGTYQDTYTVTVFDFFAFATVALKAGASAPTNNATIAWVT